MFQISDNKGMLHITYGLMALTLCSFFSLVVIKKLEERSRLIKLMEATLCAKSRILLTLKYNQRMQLLNRQIEIAFQASLSPVAEIAVPAKGVLEGLKMTQNGFHISVLKKLNMNSHCQLLKSIPPFITAGHGAVLTRAPNQRAVRKDHLWSIKTMTPYHFQILTFSYDKKLSWKMKEVPLPSHTSSGAGFYQHFWWR